MLALIAGFVLSTTTVVFFTHELSSLLRNDMRVATDTFVGVGLCGCIALDLRYPRGRCSLLRRQTPRHLVARFPRTLGGFLWGLDTGSMVSTFRSSAATWAALLLAIVGWVPGWAGIVYAIAFCLPLAFGVALRSRANSRWVRRFAGDLWNHQEQVGRAARRAVYLRRGSALSSAFAVLLIVANLD